MKLFSGSSVRRSAAALAVVAALAGCSSSSPTPVIVILTPTSAASTPAPTATTTPAPSATPTLSPSPSPTGAADACTGTAANKAFFLEAASKLNFDVYCAVLPSGWWIQSGYYVQPDGGYLNVDHRNSAGAVFTLREGGWCAPEHMCISPGVLVGPASFGGLAGTLYVNGAMYTLQVGTYADRRYVMTGQGMTQAQFKAWAAALHKVG